MKSFFLFSLEGQKNYNIKKKGKLKVAAEHQKLNKAAEFHVSSIFGTFRDLGEEETILGNI